MGFIKMKAIIFDSEEHAKQWDWDNNSLTGSISKYRYSRQKLADTTTLTKAQYAELFDIPATIQAVDTEGNVVDADNQAYLDLENSYTLNKYALMVGDDFAVSDEEGNLTYENGEVEITDAMKFVSEEI